MLTTNKRIKILSALFEELQQTSSRLEKQELIKAVPEFLSADLMYCLAVLDNRVMFGYKMADYASIANQEVIPTDSTRTVVELIDECLRPWQEQDLSQQNIIKHLRNVVEYFDFLQPIVDKELRLGIGKSLLSVDVKAPMLAKKFSDMKVFTQYAVTEKLDGIRCIAYFDNNKWHFISRNGRVLNVDFDTSGLSEQLIYDGELLSGQQTRDSIERVDLLVKNIVKGHNSNSFSETSGIVNRKQMAGKDLVYNIFDIQTNGVYRDRQVILENTFKNTINNDHIRILPVLEYLNFDDLNAQDRLMTILENITANGGEGLMLNRWDGLYMHKRTDALLKVKKTFSMDMTVASIYPGAGKYENVVGSLSCYAEDLGGTTYACAVGSGLSDQQRKEWIADPTKIVGKIVEIEYFEVTQDKSLKGSNLYSLRFPRLKRVRGDKNETSTF